MGGPLDGLRILDFSSLLPGPYASMFLADLGADVLRVVSKTRPDMADMVPPLLPGSNISASAAFLGRGKRAISLNLKHPRAVAVVQRLIERYDIILEQFRPGVMDKLGLGYQALGRLQPRLIYCSLTGYGQTGPLKDRAGHDVNYLARSGLLSYSGRRDGGPTLMGMQIADVAAGSMNAVVGILAAVIARQASGQGQHVDVSMTDGAMAFNAMAAAGALAADAEPGREGTMLNGGSLYDIYETSDGGHLSVGSLEPKFFEALCLAIDRPDCVAGWVAPPDLPRVKEQIRQIFKGKTMAQWVEIFEKVDACVEPVLGLREAFDQPLAQARQWVVEVPAPDGRTLRQPGPPIKFSATPARPGQAWLGGPTDNAAVLAQAGFAPEEIAELSAEPGLFE